MTFDASLCQFAVNARPIIIVGASTRAAAQSAVRSGFEPWCADQFADDDLRDCAHILPMNAYPNELPRVLKQAPNAPWFYTGGLENRPRLVDQLARIRPLLGNSGDVLRRIRDPFWVAEHLTESGYPVLPVSRKRPIASNDRQRWLKKPRASAGGRGISFAEPQAHSAPANRGHYFQTFAEGVPVSGTFVAGTRNATLLGLTRQLVGEAATHASVFGYSGSIGPLTYDDLPRECFVQAEGIGASLATDAKLVGLFGIDFISDVQRRTLWPVEVNPRYTASMELIEWGLRQPLLPSILDHVEVNANSTFLTSGSSAILLERDHTVRYGKLVLYAANDLKAPTFRKWNLNACDDKAFEPFDGHFPIYTRQEVTHLEAEASDAADEVAWLADIPTPGSSIAAGQPVLTVMARAATVKACYDRLVREAQEVDKLLQSHTAVS